MRTRDVERLKKQLLERKERIVKNLQEAAREIEALSETEINDDGDYATVSTDNMIDSAISDQQQKELQEIEYALEKIDEENYGECEMCGEFIGVERLRVKPHAKFCITCREIYEKTLRK